MGLGERVSVELEVPFHDLDPMKIVWHGNYYKYVEISRTALMRRYDLDGQAVIGAGYSMVVIETRCRHTSPLEYGDRFEVSSWFKDVEHRLNVGFEITNLTSGKRAAKGHSILATLGKGGNLLLETPALFLERILG